jgi:hypothetical protein
MTDQSDRLPMMMPTSACERSFGEFGFVAMPALRFLHRLAPADRSCQLMKAPDYSDFAAPMKS